MNDVPRPTIGVIGSLALAGALQANDLAEVISGETDEQAAEAIQSALDQRTDLTMIIVVTDATRNLPQIIANHDIRPRRMITLVDGNNPDHRELLDDKTVNPRPLPVPLNVLMSDFGHPSTPETMSLWLTPDGQQVIRRGAPQPQEPQRSATMPTPESVATANSPQSAPQRAMVSEPEPEPQPSVPTPQSQVTPEVDPAPMWVDERTQRASERERLVDGMDNVRLIGESADDEGEGFLSDAPRRQGAAPVVFVGAPKGGVGKSTTSISLAHRAAQRGLRVVWIEGDIGNPQAAHHFGLGETFAALPTVMDYHISRSIVDATVSPSALQEARHNPKQPKFGFGVVLAPTEAELAKQYITANTYREMIKKLRRQVDLVVVDLHQFAALDPLGMLEKLVVPMVRDDRSSRLLMLNDGARTGLAGVDEWIGKWTSKRVDNLPAERIITIQNDIPVDDVTVDPQKTFTTTANRVAEMLARHSFYAGTVWRDNQIIRHTNHGTPVGDHPVWRYVLDQVLARVLGLPIESDPFDPYAEEKGFFARIFGKSKK